MVFAEKLLDVVEIGKTMTLATKELDFFGNNMSYYGEIIKIDKENKKIVIDEYNNYIGRNMKCFLDIDKIYYYHLWS